MSSVPSHGIPSGYGDAEVACGRLFPTVIWSTAKLAESGMGYQTTPAK